ncbi:unnamed protein product [Calicophoron daubneyi]|uniref:Pyroglutamyl-peptidase I n=1 Tax=Calicophoron daubneyi TaxID=300641 RepID=A0AAV2TIJ7_CALDB
MTPRKRCIVLTGFGPFGDIEENSSSIAVHALQDLWEANDRLHSGPVELITFEDVPVSYKAVQELETKIWALNPELVIHVGLYSGANSIYLEKQSFNGPYLSPDVNEELCDEDGFCNPDGEERICSTLDLNRVLRRLESHSVPAHLSEDPGRYLCGYIYYMSLKHACDRVVFIHVPPISDRFDDFTLASALFDVVQGLAEQRNLPIPTVKLRSK